MANDERKKTLSYLRAVFSNSKANTLAHYLKQAHAQTPDIAQRTFMIDDQEVCCCHFSPKKNGRHYVHLATSTPGEPASVVPKLSGVKLVDLRTTLPPKQTDFMDGDILLLIQENHVLFCSTGAHKKKVVEYCRALFEETGQPQESRAFSLVNVANVDKINLIREKGVKSLQLNSGLYTATVSHEDRVHRSVRSKIFQTLTDEIKGLFAEDETLKEFADAENLTAELIIRFDKRFKGGEIGQRRIESLAEMVLDDEEDGGFKIVTHGGERISPESIALKKQVKMTKDGNTVAYQSAWSAMRQYMDELQEKGLLEQ